MNASQSISLVKSRAHSSAILESDGEGLAQKGGERVPLALVRWQCGAKEQAAEKRARLEKEALQAGWSDDLAGVKEV